MPRSLRLEDFSDMELLHRIDDEGDDDGYVTTEQMIGALRITHDHPASCIGIRFAWMVKYGVIEKGKERATWRLTDAGMAAVHSGLTKGQSNLLERVSPEQGMDVVSAIATLAAQNRNRPYGHLMRRAWQHGTARRNGRR